MDHEQLSPLVWGPHLWHTLFTFALSYPVNPNTITKRKYYDFIQNLPLFLPNAEIRKTFGEIINNYPVQPYLKTRESFVRWVHFVHNVVNRITGRPDISLYEALDKYYAHYRTPIVSVSKTLGISKSAAQNAFIFSLVVAALVLMRDRRT